VACAILEPDSHRCWISSAELGGHALGPGATDMVVRPIGDGWVPFRRGSTQRLLSPARGGGGEGGGGGGGVGGGGGGWAVRRLPGLSETSRASCSYGSKPSCGFRLFPTGHHGGADPPALGPVIEVYPVNIDVVGALPGRLPARHRLDRFGPGGAPLGVAPRRPWKDRHDQPRLSRLVRSGLGRSTFRLLTGGREAARRQPVPRNRKRQETSPELAFLSGISVVLNPIPHGARHSLAPGHRTGPALVTNYRIVLQPRSDDQRVSCLSCALLNARPMKYQARRDLTCPRTGAAPVTPLSLIVGAGGNKLLRPCLQHSPPRAAPRPLEQRSWQVDSCLPVAPFVAPQPSARQLPCPAQPDGCGSLLLCPLSPPALLAEAHPTFPRVPQTRFLNAFRLPVSGANLFHEPLLTIAVAGCWLVGLSYRGLPNLCSSGCVAFLRSEAMRMLPAVHGTSGTGDPHPANAQSCSACAGSGALALIPIQLPGKVTLLPWAVDLVRQGRLFSFPRGTGSFRLAPGPSPHRGLATSHQSPSRLTGTNGDRATAGSNHKWRLMIQSKRRKGALLTIPGAEDSPPLA